MTDVQVMFDYVAQADDELNLKVGEIVTGSVKITEGWSEGVLHGRRGMFPDNFVRAIPLTVKDKSPISPAASQGDKSIAAPRQKNVPTSSVSAGGVSELRTKLGGIIGATPGAAMRGVRKSVIKKVKVTNAYVAQNPDELSLEVGTVIDVLKQEEEGWWEGSLNGKIGMFPSNFVETIDVVADGGDKTAIDQTEIKGRKVRIHFY